MRVLMLDKNILVDRRIDLFSMSLKRLGHETRLLYLEPPQGFDERFSVDIEAIPVGNEAVSSAAVSNGVFLQPSHVRDVLYPFSIDGRTRQEEFESLRKNLIGDSERLGLRDSIKLALAFPDVARRLIRGRSKLSAREVLATWMLGIASAPLYLQERLAPPVDGYPKASPTGVPLTHFDQACVRHAVEVYKPDIVTANDFPTLRAALTIKMLVGTPVVYDAHELYSYQPGIEPLAARRIFAEERQLLKHIDGLIVMNESQARITERDFGYRGQYAVCTNATNRPAGFDANRRYDLFRQKLPIPSSHKIMLFQGGVNIPRRIDYLLRGLSKARRSDVHMVFLTWGREVDDFKVMAEQLGISSRVHFLPFVDWDEVLFYAASADCGFMPYQATDQNTSISSPNKMYEFIMAGTPMIGSSDLYYVNQIVGGQGFGVVRPLRADVDYALAIEEMFDERLGGPERFRAALIEKGDAYSWDNEVRGAIRMYEAIHSESSQAMYLPKVHVKARRVQASEISGLGE